MKKVFTILALAILASVVACGPSEAEKAAKEQRDREDSIAASLRNAETEDSLIESMMPGVPDSLMPAASTDSVSASH